MEEGHWRELMRTVRPIEEHGGAIEMAVRKIPTNITI